MATIPPPIDTIHKEMRRRWIDREPTDCVAVMDPATREVVEGFMSVKPARDAAWLSGLTLRYGKVQFITDASYPPGTVQIMAKEDWDEMQERTTDA